MTEVFGQTTVAEALHSSVHEVAKLILEKGYQIFTADSRPDIHFAWPNRDFYFTDGKRIGYCQYDNLNGLVFCQVLKGHGFGNVYDYKSPLSDLVEKTLNEMHERQYQDFAEFLEYRKQIGALYAVQSFEVKL
jgi:hypothetical protein